MASLQNLPEAFLCQEENYNGDWRGAGSFTLNILSIKVIRRSIFWNAEGNWGRRGKRVFYVYGMTFEGRK